MLLGTLSLALGLGLAWIVRRAIVKGEPFGPFSGSGRVANPVLFWLDTGFHAVLAIMAISVGCVAIFRAVA